MTSDHVDGNFSPIEPIGIDDHRRTVTLVYANPPDVAVWRRPSLESVFAVDEDFVVDSLKPCSMLIGRPIDADLIKRLLDLDETVRSIRLP